MRPYRPRMATVAKLRESLRDDKRQNVADAMKAEGILIDQQEQLTTEITTVIADRREATQSKSINPSLLIASQRYENDLIAQKKQVAENLVAVKAETARRQQELILAEKELRSIELLEERGKQQHEEEQRRKTQLELDEIASQRAMSRQRAEANNDLIL